MHLIDNLLFVPIISEIEFLHSLFKLSVVFGYFPRSSWHNRTMGWFIFPFEFVTHLFEGHPLHSLVLVDILDKPI
jgi:hypothetical protein